MYFPIHTHKIVILIILGMLHIHCNNWNSYHRRNIIFLIESHAVFSYTMQNGDFS